MNKRNLFGVLAPMIASNAIDDLIYFGVKKPAYEPTPEELARRDELEQEKIRKAKEKRERRCERNLRGESDQ